MSQSKRSARNLKAPVLQPPRRWEAPPTGTFPRRRGRRAPCRRVGSCWWDRSSSSWSPFFSNNYYCQKTIRKNGYIVGLSREWEWSHFSQILFDVENWCCVSVCYYLHGKCSNRGECVTECVSLVFVMWNRMNVTRCMVAFHLILGLHPQQSIFHADTMFI